MGGDGSFSRERPLPDFYKYFSRRARSDKIWFFLLEIKKTTFFADIFKIRGGLMGEPVANFSNDPLCLKSEFSP